MFKAVFIACVIMLLATVFVSENDSDYNHNNATPVMANYLSQFEAPLTMPGENLEPEKDYSLAFYSDEKKESQSSEVELLSHQDSSAKSQL